MHAPWEGKQCISQDILSPLFTLQQQMSLLFCHRTAGLQHCAANNPPRMPSINLLCVRLSSR